MRPYLCLRCCKTFEAVSSFLTHTRRTERCQGQKPVLVSDYYRQQNLRQETLTGSNGAEDEFAALSGRSNSTRQKKRNRRETPNVAEQPAPFLAPAPFPTLPNPFSSCIPTNIDATPSFAAFPSECQFGYSISTENKLGTYQSPRAPDPYSFPPVSPLSFSNPFPFLALTSPAHFVHSPSLSNSFDGGLQSTTLAELHWNPWIGGFGDTGGGVRRDNAEGEVNVGQSEPAVLTESSGAINEGTRVEPGPGVTNDDDIQNLLRDKDYIRIVGKGRIIYRHRTAGRTYGRGQTRWEAEREKNKLERGGNPYGMWASKDEWETAKWMATEKVLQLSINKLLKTERYKDAGYLFKNAKSLFKKIKDEMGAFGGPEWHVDDLALADAPKDKGTLFFKDIQKVADFQFGQARFAGKISFAPEKHYDADDIDRLYDNPWTADDWGDRQESLPTGTTWGGLLFASDSTILSTHSGDVAVHAVYMTLANLDRSVRACTSENAWVLVAYIPKLKFEHAMSALKHRPKAVRTKILGMLNRRLFHRCMTIITRPLRRQNPHDVIDPEGNVRSVVYGLTGYIADLEEQWLVAGLGGQTCPHCVRDSTHLGDTESGLPRTRADFLKQLDGIKTAYKDTWGRSPSLEEYLDLAGEKHFNGVNKPFWRFLPGVDIFQVLSPNLLHGFHKFFYNHIYRFNRTGMGLDEYNARIQLQPQFSGDRAFLHGVSHISQMTGIEHRLLEQTHLPIVANAPGVINEKVTRATWGIMECVYLAQLPIQSDRTLQAYEAAYEAFMANRQAWIDNGTRRGKKEVIPHFNIPKMHVIRHHTHHVRRKGSATNYTTETMEHLHIGVKEAYRASNWREWKQQTVRWLNRRDMVRDFEAWMSWCRAEEERDRGGREEPANEPTWCLDNETQDGSNNSSVDVEGAEGDCGSKCECNDESEGEEELEGEAEDDEYEDPDAYGEQIVDECKGEWEGEMGVENNKRKRRTDLGNTNPARSKPRPRLAAPQATLKISDLQKVNHKPKARQTPIWQICQDYDLDLVELMQQINQCPQITDLPTPVDEHTEINVWHSLQARLCTAAHRSGARMQRIRSKPSSLDRTAKRDPVFFVNVEGKTAWTTKLHAKSRSPHAKRLAS
ncbi:hypothetical protein FRC07_000968 [Ceratobasidium sp. 392]|nr:hypothetical protein FRC07_000968 [Ceratobasidium sp. 392]